MRSRAFLLALATLLLSAPCLTAQNPYEDHSRAMYAGAQKKYSVDAIESMRFDQWQRNFRLELKEKLGISVIESQLKDFVPVAAKLSSEDLGFAWREKWSIKVEPDVDLPFVLLVPKDLKGPAPLMITPHGHSKNTELSAGIYHNAKDREKGEEGERNVALQAVQHGFIAIAPTARGFGETRLPKDIEEGNTSSCRDLYLRDALVGRTPVGDRVWDIMKLIDWALTNLPVDGRNIIVSGNSGGGTATLYAGAVDTRISMSLPASAFCDFEASIGHRRHCECNYVPGIMNLADMGEIAGLTAPRAFCAIHGVEDPIFPIDGTRKAFEVTRRIYEMAGVPDNCSLYEGSGGHRYYKAGAWEFIMSHLDKEVSFADAGKILPAWQEGMLDLHFISTGSGNCSFCILPDGTTLLVDAGSLTRPDPRAPSILPDESRSVGAWISDYIRQFSPAGKDTRLDYALLTHFHDDHFGALEEVTSTFPTSTMIDRRTAVVGSSSQIRLLKSPSDFPDFKIRILFAEGKVAHKTKEKVAFSKYKDGDNPSENCLSVGFRLDYGPFRFYSGGDIPGIGHTGATDPKSMECLVAPLIGPVDVAVLNHHGNRDTQCAEFVSTLAPRVWIGQCWGIRHPGEEVIRRISSKYVYPGDRDIYATYMAPECKTFMNRYTEAYKSTEGHIVVRVAPGGESYDVYVLDDTNSYREVLLTNHYNTK